MNLRADQFRAGRERGELSKCDIRGQILHSAIGRKHQPI